MQANRRIAMAVDRAVSAIGLAQMVQATGLKRRTVQNDMENISSPTLARVLAYVQALDEAGLREVSAELLDALLAPVGREARPVAQVCPEVPPAVAALRLSAETGDVVRWIEHALSDGVIDPAEAAEGEREIRHVRHELDAVDAIVRGASARSPQRSLDLNAGGR